MAQFSIQSLTNRIYAPLAFAIFLFAAVFTTGGAQAKDIRVEIDEAMLLKLEHQAAQVIIGNPAIADVAVQNGKLLAITGKSFGVTNLIVVDSKGKQILSKNIAVGIDNSRYVTVHKGRSRASYICTPTCQAALIPGDNADHFEGISKEIRNKFGIAQSAADGSQAPQ